MRLRIDPLGPLLNVLGKAACCGMLALGCAGDDRSDSPNSGSATLDGGDDGASGPGESGDDGDESGDDGSDGDTGNGEDDSGGDDLTCGQPQSCDQPPPPSNVGRASNAPRGCGGSGFELGGEWDVRGGGAKAVPVAGDVDDDGNVDILLNPRKMNVMMFQGGGDGSFANPKIVSAGSLQCGWGPDLGDFDNDGLLDLVLGDHCQGPRAWQNGGNMSFFESHGGLDSNAMVSGCGTADLNGDGNLDMACGADQFSTGFAVAFGDGQGGWTPAAVVGMPQWSAVEAVPTNTGYFAFADYDHDGDLDVFAGGQRYIGAMAMFVYRNEGDGITWTPAAVLDGGFDNNSGGSTIQGSIGDVNCDGHTDVAAGGTVYVGADGGWPASSAVNGAHISHFGDIDGDGYLDLVTFKKTQYMGEPAFLRVHLNDGTGQSWAQADLGLPEGDWIPPNSAPTEHPVAFAYGLDVVDLNGDGRLDILRSYELGSSSLRMRLEAWVQQP